MDFERRGRKLLPELLRHDGGVGQPAPGTVAPVHLLDLRDRGLDGSIRDRRAGNRFVHVAGSRGSKTRRGSRRLRRREGSVTCRQLEATLRTQRRRRRLRRYRRRERSVGGSGVEAAASVRGGGGERRRLQRGQRISVDHRWEAMANARGGRRAVEIDGHGRLQRGEERVGRRRRR